MEDWTKAETQEGAEQRLLEEKADFQQLLATAGWKRFEHQIQAQIDARREMLELKPCTTQGEVYAQEFLKGEITALRTLLTWASSREEMAQGQLDYMKQAREMRPDPNMENEDVPEDDPE